MGNKPFRIALKVDDLQYEAGDLVKGSVQLSVGKEESLRGVQGIHLLLEGYEHAEIAHKRNVHEHDRRVHEMEHHTERSTNSLVRCDYPIVEGSDIKIGRYEYTFQWRLPPNLPSSMYCKKDKDSRSFVEIRYTLTAYLATALPIDSLPRADATICVTARPSPQEVIRQPIIMEMERYPLNSCWFWNKGNIQMGWQTESNVASPSDAVAVQVVGENRSHAQVEHLSVKWVETVSWTTGPGQRKSHKRTLSEQILNVDGLASWQPWYNPDASLQEMNQMNYQSLPSASGGVQNLVTQLKLPKDARDTYSGRLLKVHHTLIVTAKTKGCWTTSPESACQVRVVRRPKSAPAPGGGAEGTATTASTSLTSEYIPEAQVLSTDWGPVVTDAVALPEAAAVLLDEDLVADSAMRTEASAQQHPIQESTLQPAPSAPDESLLVGEGSNAENNHASEHSYYSQPDLKQLLTLVKESPDNLEAVLQDAAWAAFVQNLTPRDYAAVVQAAAHPTTRCYSVAPTVAYTLALTMRPRFQCRHLLACLWSLPVESDRHHDQRMLVLRRVAPLVSDLAENQALLEQELNPKELAHFRAALSGRS